MTGIVFSPAATVFRQEIVPSMSVGSIANSLFNPNSLKSAVIAAISDVSRPSPSFAVNFTDNTLLSL